jgi:hypothetical protein
MFPEMEGKVLCILFKQKGKHFLMIFTYMEWNLIIYSYRHMLFMWNIWTHTKNASLEASRHESIGGAQ